jgi:hypothetical protein
MDDNIKSLNTVEDYIEEAKFQNASNYILNSIQVLKSAEDKLLAGEIKYIDPSKHEKAYDFFINDPFVSQLYKDNDRIFHCLDNYKQINKREPDRSYDGIDNWFIKEEKINSMSISGRVTIACNFFHMLAVFRETDLLQETVGSIEELKVINKEGITRWLAKALIKMPLSLTNRELFIYGYGVFLKKENMVMIPIYSPNEEELSKYYQEKPNQDLVRIDMKFGYYLVRYLDENHCEFFSCFNIDPKISYVPWFILNNCIKEFGYYFMRDFRKAAEDVKLFEIYQKRINEHPEFYDFIREALNIKK